MYQKFQEELIHALEEKVEKSVVRIQNIKKNNGVNRMGLTMLIQDENAVPTIYLEEYYEDYTKGKSIDQISDEVYDTYNRYRLKEQIDLSFLDLYDSVRNRIFLKAINREKNDELLKEVPYKEFMDLALVPYFFIEEGPFGTASALVKNDFLRIWGVGADRVINDAMSNMRENFDYEFVPMSELLSRMIEQKALDEDGNEFMYVLAPKKWNFGAALMAVSDIMEKIAEQIQSDFFVLPSSIHEIIVVPAESDSNLSKMSEMVTEVNKTSVEDQDYLSDRAYYYQRGIGYSMLQ